MSERTPEEKAALLMMATMNWCRWASLVLRYTIDTYGPAALEGLKKTFYEAGKKVGPIMIRALKIEERDATTLAKIVDMGDESVDIIGEWIELTPGRAVKHEKECPIARGLRNAPEFCTHLIPAFMTGEAEGMEIPFKASIPQHLAKGDPICEIVIEPK